MQETWLYVVFALLDFEKLLKGLDCFRKRYDNSGVDGLKSDTPMRYGMKNLCSILTLIIDGIDSNI